MFDVGWGELLVIAIVLIVVVGPKDLPRMLRAFGKTTAKMRAMASEFRTQFDEAMKDADLDEVRKTISDARSLNPTNSLREMMNPLRQVGDEIRTSLDDAVKPNSITKPSEEDADVLSSVQVSEPAPLPAEPAAKPARKKATTGKKTAATTRARKAKTAASSEAVAESAPVKTPRKTSGKSPKGAAGNGAARKTAKAANGAAKPASSRKAAESTAKAAPATKASKPRTPKAPARKTAARTAVAPGAAAAPVSPDPGLNGAGKTENT